MFLISFSGQNASLDIWMKPQDYFYDYVQAQGTDIEWHVNFKGNPSPTTIWQDVYGKEIPWGRKGKIHTTKGNQWAKLKIRNLTCEDSGEYVFLAENMLESKKQIFRLSVEGKINRFVEEHTLDFHFFPLCLGIAKLKMPKSFVVRPGGEVNFDCEILSYPKSVVQCFFKPCTTSVSCDNEVELLTVSSQMKYSS